MGEKLLSARECARALGISELGIHRYLRSINAPKQLGVYAVPAALVERLKKQRAKRGAA